MAGVTTGPGLSAREAADRLARDGPNELPAERPRGGAGTRRRRRGRAWSRSHGSRGTGG
ncbi:MAG: cation-transporting P-type ATPase [Actinomycetota bacterium]